MALNSTLGPNGWTADIPAPVSGGVKSPNGVQRAFLAMPTPPVNGTAGAAKTYDVQHPAKRAYHGVRLVFMNLNTAAVATYIAVRVGGQTKHLANFGNQITWSGLLTVGNNTAPVTFTAALTAATSGTLATAWAGTTGLYAIVFSDGSARATTLTNASTAVSWTGAVTATASATAYPQIVVPVAQAADTTNHVRPGFAITDFMPTQPVARTDTPTGKYMLRSRAACPAEAQYVYSVGSAYVPAWNAAVGSAGMQIGSYMANGDNVTVYPTDGTYTIVENGGNVQPVIALFSYNEPGLQVWAFGDSLFQGVGSSVGATAGNGVLGWPTLVHSQQTYTDVLNMAVSGQKTSDSVSIMKRMVDACADLPAYVCIKVYSPNDGNPTQALIDASWGYVLDAVSFLRSRRIVPVLFTSPPVNSWNATQHGFNEAQNARAVALAAAMQIVKIVDMAAAVADPGNPRTIRPAYDYDGTHYLDAGHQAIADAAVRVLV